MTALFSFFLNASFYGSVMILLALLLRPILRQAPKRILCFLWLFVMVRLLLPISIESKFSLQPQVTPSQVIVEQLPEAPNAPLVQTPVIPSPEFPPAPDVTPPVQPALTVANILPVAWFCGVCIMFAHMVVTYGLLRYQIRDATPCEKGVWETSRISGAFMLGYVWPQIYLPTDLDPVDRQLIIAHEKSHIRRGDAWWKLLGMLCLCIHWYNPLVWLTHWLMSRDIETACDEQVIHTMPLSQRKAYSYALLNAGKRMSGIFVFPVAFSEVNLKQRIKKVLSYRNPGIWITSVGIIICVCLVVFFMLDPAPQQRGNPVQNNTQSTQSTESTEGTTQTESTGTSETIGATVHTHNWQVATCTTPKICTICGTAEGSKAGHNYIHRQCTVCGALLPTEELRFMLNADSKSYRCDNYLGTDPDVVIPGEYNGLPVTQIGRFGNSCPVLIILPDSITVIEESAFQYSGRLASITLPSGLTTIGQFAFAYCPALETISIPTNVTSIGEGAFQNCTSLETITLPAKLTYIGESAFQNCTQLKFIYFSGTVAQWNAIEKGKNWNSADLDKDKVLESTVLAAGVTCTDGFIPF